MNSPLRYTTTKLDKVSVNNSFISDKRKDVVLNFRSSEIACKKGNRFTCIISMNRRICLNLFFNEVGTFKSVGDMLTNCLVLFNLSRSVTISGPLISIDL